MSKSRRAPLPIFVQDFEKVRDKFTKYLIECGGEIKEPKGDWEVLRVTGKGKNKVTLLLHRKKSDRLTWSSELRKAWKMFQTGQAFGSFTQKKARKPLAKTKRKLLVERDGDECWFCGTTESELTQEHLLSVSSGGSNNIKNLVLACQPCNNAVGIDSIAEKVYYREFRRFQ